MTCAIHWFRRDLRLTDNPALTRALQSGVPVIPVYIHGTQGEGDWAAGSASRWWLHHSLHALDQSLRALGSRLVIRSGEPFQVLSDLSGETGAASVFWNRRYEPAGIALDSKIKAALREQGLRVETCNSALLYEPLSACRSSGEPYKVFTPFWKNLKALGLDLPVLPAPTSLPPIADSIASLELRELNLLPTIPWDTGLKETWRPGEAGAHQCLEHFLASALAGYAARRDFPAEPGTSRLSPHLHFGEIGPRQIVSALRTLPEETESGREAYVRELAWREFAHHLLFHFPTTPEQPLDERFQDFPWAEAEPEILSAWQRGRTGIPLVDAGMRELWHTGWMHNRVRMVVASFLVKNLRIHWRHGARWFWDTLVDADLANNTLGWQWTAGCGADAAPYFRVFNPVLQGAKFDPSGAGCRNWPHCPMPWCTGPGKPTAVCRVRHAATTRRPWWTSRPAARPPCAPSKPCVAAPDAIPSRRIERPLHQEGAGSCGLLKFRPFPFHLWSPAFASLRSRSTLDQRNRTRAGLGHRHRNGARPRVHPLHRQQRTPYLRRRQRAPDAGALCSRRTAGKR